MAKPRRKRVIRYRPIITKTDKSITFSYKRVAELKRFLDDQGALLSRTRTGLTQKQQRRFKVAVKRARQLAMLPFTQTL